MDEFRIDLPTRGVELAVRDWGGGGALAVLSHANGFCGRLYEPIAERLRERYRVLSFDSRGHGDSSAPEAEGSYEWSEFAGDWRAIAGALCERVGVARVALAVGHSFGGTCLLHAAAADPGRFERGVVVDPVIIPPPGERSGPFQGEGPHPMAVAARHRTPVFPSRAEIRASWSRRGVFEDWSKGVLELYLQHGFRDLPDGRVALKCAPDVEAAVYQSGPRSDLFEVLPRVRCPVLWLHAGLGNFPVELARRGAALAPDVAFRSLDRGHLMPMTHPQEVAALVLEWAPAATG